MKGPRTLTENSKGEDPSTSSIWAECKERWCEKETVRHILQGGERSEARQQDLKLCAWTRDGGMKGREKKKSGRRRRKEHRQIRRKIQQVVLVEEVQGVCQGRLSVKEK